MKKEYNIMIDTLIVDEARVLLEFSNGRSRSSQGSGVDTVLQLMREVILILWRINLTKYLCRFLNQNYSAWKNLKVTANTIWCAAPGLFIWEGISQAKHRQTM